MNNFGNTLAKNWNTTTIKSSEFNPRRLESGFICNLLNSFFGRIIFHLSSRVNFKPVIDLCDIIDPNNADYKPEDINTEIFSVDSDPSQTRDWTIYLNTNGTDVEFNIGVSAI